jgi:hypothetical protein
MSRSSCDEWFALHTQYLIASDEDHHGLLMDAHVFWMTRMALHRRSAMR